MKKYIFKLSTDVSIAACQKEATKDNISTPAYKIGSV